jgi:hypothetical protein
VDGDVTTDGWGKTDGAGCIGDTGDGITDDAGATKGCVDVETS